MFNRGRKAREQLDLERIEIGQIEKLADRVAADSSRRGFLSRVGRGLVLATAGGAIASTVKSGESEAYHFCGHTFTTDSCPHPTGLPRVDARGSPLRAKDGKRIDDLGRVVNRNGEPVDDAEQLLLDPDDRPLAPAPRSPVCDNVAKQYEMSTSVDGSWFRCCGGSVRKLMDCCSQNKRRINGDASLEGYCFKGRRVFCVMYYQTKVPC